MSLNCDPPESNREAVASTKPLQSGGTSCARAKTRLVRRTLSSHIANSPNDSPDLGQPHGSVTVIGGPGRGTSYDMTEKSMSIGRASSQEIHLPQDDAISRECHAIIGFNPDVHRFMIFNGGKANPIWVNAEEIEDAAILENGDIIKIGQTTLCLTYC